MENRIARRSRITWLVGIGLVFLFVAMFTSPYWAACFFGVEVSPKEARWAYQNLCPNKIPDSRYTQETPTAPTFNEEVVVYLQLEKLDSEAKRLINVWTVEINGEVFAEHREVSLFARPWKDAVVAYCYEKTQQTISFFADDERISCTLHECNDSEGRIVPLIWLSPKPECP